MSVFHSIVLGIVQGITEFFPISSSAHLALLERIFGVESKLQVTTVLHFGSLLALLVTMRSEIKEIITKKLRFVWLLIIATIPAGIVGITLKSKIELSFENPTLIGVSLVLTGMILWFTRNRKQDVNQTKQITLFYALLIGIAQAMAIIPGISRSGITIAVAIYLGINRLEAAKFSFLLAIIAILGANILEIKTIQESSLNYFPLLVGLLFSFITSYFAIRTLLKIVSTKKFSLFALYCWLLGFIVLFLNF